MAKNTITAKEINEFLTECIDLCKKAVFKAAKKLKKEMSFDDIDEFIEALGESEFPQKYRKKVIKIVDDLCTKVGVEDKSESDEFRHISDIEEIVGMIQLGNWLLESLPENLKDSPIDDMFPGF